MTLRPYMHRKSSGQMIKYAYVNSYFGFKQYQHFKMYLQSKVESPDSAVSSTNYFADLHCPFKFPYSAFLWFWPHARPVTLIHQLLCLKCKTRSKTVWHMQSHNPNYCQWVCMFNYEWQDKVFTFDSSFQIAETLGNENPTGYDEDFLERVEDDYLCEICHLPFRDPL